MLAINLRVAPKWGIITGYVENGTRFLCRTYFDRAVFDALEQEDCQDPEKRRMVFEDNEGYLFSDNWPFLILHLWIRGLSEEEDFCLERDRVNDSSTCAIAYNGVNAFGVSTRELRREQTRLLTYALSLEEENCALAGKILEILNKQYTV